MCFLRLPVAGKRRHALLCCVILAAKCDKPRHVAGTIITVPEGHRHRIKRQRHIFWDQSTSARGQAVLRTRDARDSTGTPAGPQPSDRHELTTSIVPTHYQTNAMQVPNKYLTKAFQPGVMPRSNNNPANIMSSTGPRPTYPFPYFYHKFCTVIQL